MRKRIRFLVANAVAIACGVLATNTIAQTPQRELPDGCTQWKTYTDTIWIEQDVTENRVLSETSYETKEVTKSRPRWISTQKERLITERKPVTQTSERVVTRKVTKPVTTQKTRIATRVEESWKDVTEMREETYTVEKPVVETVYEEREFRVRKPVTKRRIEREEVTVYRPSESTQTTLVPGTLLVPGTQPYTSRPRARWLRRGYYTDPVTGQQVWRRAGLHWVNEPHFGQAAVPVAVPQSQTQTTLVPETLVREKPVEETIMVDEYEMRQVPVEVERMVSETRTRKVPVTVRVPTRETVEYETPYTETTYVDEIITERIPVEETVMKTTTRREPYTELEAKWEDYTETVTVPKTTTKRVPYVATYRVPYLVEVRVPYDSQGRPAGRGQEVAGTHRLHPKWRSMMTKVGSSSVAVASRRERETSSRENSLAAATFDVPDARSVQSGATDTSATVGNSVLEKAQTKQPLGDPPNLKFSNRKSVSETSQPMKPIRRAQKVPAKPMGPVETEASKENRRAIDERFKRLGLSIGDEEPESQAEEVTTNETSTQPVASDINEEPSRINHVPQESLSIDIEPAAAVMESGNAGSDEENSDDTIVERDVDLSRQNRP